MFVSSHIKNKYSQIMSNYFYIAYLTNNIQNHKISIEGCGNLRKPHPSPELEVSLVDTYNIHQYELKMFFYATRIFDNIFQNYTVFIDSFVFGPTIPSTTNPCFA